MKETEYYLSGLLDSEFVLVLESLVKFWILIIDFSGTQKVLESGFRVH